MGRRPALTVRRHESPFRLSQPPSWRRRFADDSTSKPERFPYFPQMIDPPFRSPRERVGGLYHFGRMVDKIRCHLRGDLPEEYRRNFGLSLGLDGMLCGMLGIEHADLIERMRDGGTDGEILEWCYARGTRLNRAQIHVWNEFARKLGWNDRAARLLAKTKVEDSSTVETCELLTAFELIDYREGRAQKPKNNPSSIS